MRTIHKGFWSAMIVLMLIAAECSVTQSPPREGPAMGNPEPHTLTMRALLAGTATDVVTFESRGTSELTFTASHTGAWMRLSPRDGVVPVGETQSVEVVADCSLAAPGFNSASLVLASDDVVAPTRVIRVELTCSDDLEITSFTVDRAVVEAGESVTFSWTIVGATPLVQELSLRDGTVVFDGAGGHATLFPTTSDVYALTVMHSGGDVAVRRELAVRVAQGSERDTSRPLPASEPRHLLYPSARHDNVLSAAWYYRSIDAEPTFEAWLSAREYATSDVVGAQYFNKADLGLGRDMHCWGYADGMYACFLRNYGGKVDIGDVQEVPEPARAFHAMDQDDVVAIVAMDHDPRRDPGYAVQFYVYGPDGERLDRLELDSQGPKANPVACLGCHGGELVEDSGANTLLVRGANFAPFDVGAFVFDDLVAERSRDAQLDDFARLNRIVYETNGGSANEIRQLIELWYGTVPFAGVEADFERIPAAWHTNDAWPFTFATPEGFYADVYAPYCRICHEMRTSRPNRAASCGAACHAANPLPTADQFTPSWLTTEFLGTYPHIQAIQETVCEFDDAVAPSMPNAEVAAGNLWQEDGMGRNQLALLFAEARLPFTKDGNNCHPYPYSWTPSP